MKSCAFGAGATRSRAWGVVRGVAAVVLLAIVSSATPLGVALASPEDTVAAGTADDARAPGAPPDPAAERLSVLHRSIEQRRARVAAFERREAGLLETLDEVDRAADELADAVRRANEAMRTARQSLAEAEQLVRDAGTRREDASHALATRVTALYRAGEIGLVRALFAPGSVRERVARVQSLRLLAQRDQRLVTRYRDADRALAEATTTITAAREARRAAREDARVQRLALAEERAAREQLLAGVRTDRVREAAALSELELAAQALEDQLETLGRSPLPEAPGVVPTPFASLRGQLLPPVDAPIARRFGRVVDARFKTETLQKGIDFAARRGQSVRAVAAGTVRFADWFRGYGKMVILDHGDDFFTVSGHLDEIAVAPGDVVESGHELGRAGDTGSLSGARLYFEIRRGKEALDPAAWLHR